MSDSQEKAFRSWSKFLDPMRLKANLIVSSVYLVAYETLRASIIDQIRDFFAIDFDEHGGKISEQYKVEVLSLNKNRPLASLLWLRKTSVIDDADISMTMPTSQCFIEFAFI